MFYDSKGYSKPKKAVNIIYFVNINLRYLFLIKTYLSWTPAGLVRLNPTKHRLLLCFLKITVWRKLG